MIPELGQLCLCLALLVAALQGCMPFLHRWQTPHSLLPLVKPLATVQFMLISSAFAALFYSYITSDFSVMNVFTNSHRDKPMLYKIVGTWGNHEGSMMLWAWILSAYGFALAYLRPRERELTHLALAVLGALAAGLLAFILITSNPFLRLFPTPPNGQDLNPLLQDIGLAFHPPILYFGYVGFAVVFCYAIAGLARGSIDRHWAKQVHPYILLPWSALTMGIGAGSWWAYRELGWGGWWFWDPVENVSLLPWLVGTALLHANIVLEKRGQLARWSALLAILAFGMALVGTFIVRSGLVTSVHAFASDPTRGVFILAYIFLTTGGALALFSWRALPPAPPARLASRTGLIMVGNLLLVAMTATVLLAILYPVFLQLMNAPGVSVGPSYFNRTFLPLCVPLILLAAIGPLVPWDRFTRGQLTAVLRQLVPAVLAGMLIVLAFVRHDLVLAMLGSALAAWLLWGCVLAFQRARRATQLFTSRRGWRQVASLMAHSGAALMVLGVTATGLFKETYEMPLVAGQDLRMGAYELHLMRATRTQEANYTARRALFSLRRDGRELARLAPELRYYPVRDMQTTESALYSTPWRDIYVVIGDAAKGEKTDNAIGVRMYITPGQQWVWASFLLIGAGGLLAAATSMRKDVA